MECKRKNAPGVTPSIRIAIVVPGNKRCALGERVEIVPLSTLGSGERLVAH